MSQDTNTSQATQATTGLYGKTPQGESHLDGNGLQTYTGTVKWGDQRYQITVNSNCTQLAVKNLNTKDVHYTKIKVGTFESGEVKRTASVAGLTIFINDTKAEYYKEAQLNKYYAKIQNAGERGDTKTLSFVMETEETSDSDGTDF